MDLGLGAPWSTAGRFGWIPNADLVDCKEENGREGGVEQRLPDL